jgi:hypothetical protein
MKTATIKVFPASWAKGITMVQVSYRRKVLFELASTDRAAALANVGQRWALSKAFTDVKFMFMQ